MDGTKGITHSQQETAVKYSPHKVKKLICARLSQPGTCPGTQCINYWVLEEDDLYPLRFHAAGWRGDLIAMLIGVDRGEIGWEENLGSVL
jgi:hypothetical protein